MKHSPIACTLGEEEFQERRSGLITKLRAQVLEIKALDAGYALRFEPTDKILAELIDFIQLERRCCQFLEFNLKVLPEKGPIWLELRGPNGTKEFLDGIFVS